MSHLNLYYQKYIGKINTIVQYVEQANRAELKH